MIEWKTFSVERPISAISCCGCFTDSTIDKLLEFLFLITDLVQ